MTFRFINKEFCVATDHQSPNNFEIGSNFKLNIELGVLAVTPELLDIFGFISMYANSYKNNIRMGNPLISMAFGYTQAPATVDEAINFFRDYLDDFNNNKPELQSPDNLLIMVTDPNIQQKLLDYFATLN